MPVSGTCFYPTRPNLSCCSYCARQVHLHWKAQQGGGKGMCGDTPTSYPLLPFGWPPRKKRECNIMCMSVCLFLFFFSFSWREREEAGIIWGFAWCWSRGVARVAHGRDFFRLVRVPGSFFSSPVKSTRRPTHTSTIPTTVDIDQNVRLHVCANPPSCSYFVLNELIERV